MVAINQSNGIENGSGPRAQRPAILCVHFASAERCVSFAEPAQAGALACAGAARLTIEWDRTCGRVLRRRARLRGEVAMRTC